jgi:phosphoglycolate phosphatase (TIGR01487 family)
LSQKIKAFAVDIDGTITDSKSRLEFDAVSEIRRLEENGYPVILTSGRSFYSVAPAAMYIGTCGIVVAENGATIGKHSDITSILGDKRKALKGLKILKRKLADQVKLLPTLPRFSDIVLDRTFDVKVGNEILKEAGLDVHLLDSGFAYHLINGKVDKGVGLKKAAELLNVDYREIVVIGDGLNDIDMFKVASYSIALANAPKELKEIADYVTSESYGKGFCEAVHHATKKFNLKFTK